MILITQSPTGSNHHEVEALQAAATKKKWDVFVAPTSWRLPEELTSQKLQGVPYGTQTFCEVIADQMGWCLKQNPFDWLSKVPERFLHRDVEFMPLQQAKQLTETKFIKPADDKCFTAQVYPPGTLIASSVPDDTPTLVSDVVQFDLECRFFVKNGLAFDWSNYLFFGEVNNPHYWKMSDCRYMHPYYFMEYLLWAVKDFTVSSVIDIGIIRDQDWAVVETNPVWASGIYGCDPTLVLEVLETSVEMP
jgi:ATP-grasp domain, R2K clade family 2